jgi:small-conductance mechanosensitive channel
MVALLLLLTVSEIAAQESFSETGMLPEATMTAPVVIDGRHLFELRGTSSYPAKQRARAVRSNIIEIAKDDSFSVENLTVVNSENRSLIMAGEKQVMSVFDADAEIENLDRKLLAEVIRVNITKFVTLYRTDRSPKVLLTRAAFALGLTAIVILLLWVLRRLFNRLNAWATQHVQKSLKDIASKAHHLIQAGQIWTLVAGLLGAARFVSFVILLYFYLNTALGLFPWTRPAAIVLFDFVFNPIRSLWLGFVDSLPDLVFLVILFYILRYVLKLTRMFFTQVARGRIKLQNFDPDWALPTHRIVRFLIIAFSIVIAYPYIPGSDSLAFKGVSVFIGVIFSLGSSSFISNVMAGLAMTYRGAFKEGDRVMIGDVTGKVQEIKLMTTRIHTLKNESVVIPNSNILNNNVINYSVMAREPGLVLHTTVGIGYDTPWRQVEAMLLIAAGRTQGLQGEPQPFVLQTSMGDFAVNYEINAYCTDAARMVAIKSDLHRNIQDVFNEHGVQIMSPAYEMDPETPKIVPPEQWFTAPASKPE